MLIASVVAASYYQEIIIFSQGYAGMNLLSQITFGTLCLGVCLIGHVGVLAACVPVLKWHGSKTLSGSVIWRMISLTSIMLVAIVVAHSLQIWLWTLIWTVSGAVSDLNTAIYFSTVTYTTLGYGDVVLGPEWRILATFGSVAGLLTFGVSTAFLVGLIAQVFKE